MKKQESSWQNPSTSTKQQKKDEIDDWGTSKQARKKSPIHDNDDFDFMDDK